MLEKGEAVPKDVFDGIETSAKGIMGRIDGIRRLGVERNAKLKTVDQYQRLKDLGVFIAPTLGANITLEFDLQDRRPILCEGDEFESCIINLLVNAKHAMSSKGKIIIRTRQTNEYDLSLLHGANGEFLAIDIEDDGEGVPEDIAKLIFDPFFSTRRFAQGTGLGLAQVQAFCIAAGGQVYLNKNSKQGALFTLVLPITEPETKAPTCDTKTSVKPLTAKHVFVLDDDEILGKSTAKLIERFSIPTSSHATLEELKNAAKHCSQESILLSDVHMLDCHYEEVLEFANSVDKMLKTVFFSGNEESLFAIEQKYPEIQTIAKPFSASALMRVLASE